MANRTLADMATIVQVNLGRHSQLLLPDIKSMLNIVYLERVDDSDWSMRERETFLRLEAPYTTGTVAVTNGSGTVVGTGTVWTADFVGAQITIPGVGQPFWVRTFVDATHLTLGNGQGEAMTWPIDAATAQAYSIFRSVYPLPSDVGKLLWEPTADDPLTERSQSWIDVMDPKRTSRGLPTAVALNKTRIVSGAEVKTVEFYPVPSVIKIVRIRYLVDGAPLADTDVPAMPCVILEHETTARMVAYLAAKTGEMKFFELENRYSKRAAEAFESATSEDEQKRSMPTGFQSADVTGDYNRFIRTDPMRSF